MTERASAVEPLSVEDWAGEMGERWLRHRERFESMIAPIGEALLSQAAYRADECVLDVGCGAGGTSIEIARRVGARSTVVGLDISPALIAAAERSAQLSGMGNLSFRCGDAAAVSLPESPFDRLFSRFGLMFFDDAPAAFAHLRGFLRRRGRLDFCVWAAPRDNGWVAEMMAVFARSIDLPPRVPRAPGPFALEEPQYVRELLAAGGFGSIRIESWQGQQLIGGAGSTPEQATDFVFNAMSFGKLLAQSAEALQRQVREDLTTLFRQHESPEGISMGAMAYLVSAEAA
jgi:SAM-dependent methyltransferase